MLHYIIIIKFDLNDVPKICHFKYIKKSFMNFSSAKNSCYNTKKMFLGIQYSLDQFKKLPNILNIDLT